MLRFDGRVAIVTGAGRGIGRAYALLLAERGASVVVNDLGSSVTGTGASDRPAAAVAAEIEGRGGVAVADGNDVATEDGGRQLVDGAVERFGRIDVLINNAGIVDWGGFPELDAENLRRHLAVHLFGSFNTTRACWLPMVEQGHGRIVMTTSTGVFGLPDNTSYATAKAALIGLVRSAALKGAASGIRVNLIAPAAFTRMAGRAIDAGPDAAAEDPRAAQMAPALVAPMAVFLAHEDCPVSGEIYTAGAGRFARLFLASTRGYLHEGPAPTIEDVAAHWQAIRDDTGSFVPADLNDWAAAFTEHLRPRSP